MKHFVVIETTICRDCEVPRPEGRCCGVFATRAAARKCLRSEFDSEWTAHEFPQECWLSSYLSPEESPDEAWVVTKFDEDTEHYWKIEGVEE